MKAVVWREKIHSLLVEILTLLKEMAAAGGGGGGGGGGEAKYLELTPAGLGAAFTAWGDPDKGKYFDSLTQVCANFRSWLAATYVNVETVNLQWERHSYRETNPLKHADTFVLIRDRANPSRDIVVDFCYGSSEGGRLIDKLQCLWHEGPYSWWTDNAFITG